MFDPLGFADDFAFSQNKWTLKIFQNVLWGMSLKNDKIYHVFGGWGGGGRKNIKQNRGLVGPDFTIF